MSIEVSSVTKHYGAQKALDNVTFSVRKGEIVGFLGPNGAGKSTLMKILTTYLSADSGTASVNGHDVTADPREVQKSVGYLPEHNPLYPDLYVREYLEFNAGVYGIKKQRIDEVIALTGLTPEKHKKIQQLSKGYRQRVGLATALLHDPAVRMLDGPTTGLAANQRVEIRRVIKDAGKDKTVFLSTHILQEVEAICDRVIIIDKGKIVADNKLGKIIEVQKQVIEVEFDKPVEKSLIDKIPGLEQATGISGTTWELVFPAEPDRRPDVFDFAATNGLRALQISQKTRNLESVFREMTK